jgi:isopentenyl-diphosphate delta-isomerase
MRKFRKREHLENCLKTDFVGDTMFEDVFLHHSSLIDFDYDEVDLSINFLNKKMDFPLMINAMTGGTEFLKNVNTNLAELAKEFNIAMAVGSETIITEDESSIESFKVVREIIGDDGIVIANVNGHASLDDAKLAIDIINADAIQVHLNPAQELAMDEGDRVFKDIRPNIEAMVEGLDVPVIVKEVGFGLSKIVIKKLYDMGVRYVDVAGYGGTNFMEIENLRTPYNDLSDLYSWGNPTALSIIEAKQLNLDDLFIVGSGGIKSSLEIAKAMALGCDMVAICGEILKYLMHGGYDYAKEYIESLIHKTRIIAALTNSRNVSELKEVSYKLTGCLKDLAEEK